MDGGQLTSHMAIRASCWGGHMYTCLGCTSQLVTYPLVLVNLLVMLTLVHVIILICGAGDWSSDGWVAVLYIVHCQSPVIVFYPSVLCWLLVVAGQSCCTVYHVCFGGHLASCCACVSLGEILYILPKLATMSVLCSWHAHCLGWVIWWSDRNRQGFLTESVYICVFCK